jgi:hypothetical protein
MSTINHNAIHEAGHVVGALCCELRVSSVFRTSSGKYTARCELNPWRERPHVVYSMKIAGKKTQKTPQADMGLALKRKTEVT